MSASILKYTDPAGIRKKELKEVPEGTLLMDWLISNYGLDGFTSPTRIFSGLCIEENEINLYEHSEDGYPISEDEIITIIQTPGDPFTVFVVFTIIGIAAALLIVPNISVPAIPEYSQPQESPNNRLSGQENVARPFQRIPDLYGKNRVYPDLIANSYFEYISHVKFITEFVCIGRGEFLVESIKSGDTLISDIEGSSAVVYEPNTRPTDVLSSEESNEVNGQEMAAPNDGSNVDADISSASFIASSQLITTTDGNMAQLENLESGASITISGTSLNDGVYTFVSYTYISDPGEVYFISVFESIVDEAASTFNITSASNIPSAYGPFTVPGNPEEIWIDIIAPKGLQEIDGTTKNTVAVSFDVDIQEIDSLGAPVGGVQSSTITIQGNTVDPRFYTFKFTPNNPGNLHEITVERTTNTVNDVDIQYFDVTKWARLAGVVNVDSVSYPDFGDVTTVVIKTRATEQATTIQRREFNAVVTRKLKTYDTSTQMISVSTSATAKAADAAMHILNDPFMGNKSTSEIDLDELYEIQDRMDVDAIYGDKLGRFCYSLSNSNTSVGDDLATCLNAMRTFGYREGNTVHFSRDEKNDTRMTLFNNRNKRPDVESKTTRFRKPSDQDGVELQWVDEVTGDPSVIIYPESRMPTYPKRIEAAGIKNYEQAWNRAAYEWNRMLLQHTTVETEVTEDGLLVTPNARVANIDSTNILSQSGECLEVSGLDIVTDEDLDFQSQADGTVIIRDEDGTVSVPLAVTPLAGNAKGFTFTSSPPFAIFLRGKDDFQLGTLFTFFPGAANNHLANDYLITGIDPGPDGYVKLSLVNYDESIYDPDITTPTAP